MLKKYSTCLIIPFRKISFGLLALCVFPVFSFATTYYFSTSGSDNNNGLSSANPKKSIRAAKALMTNGNTILFKRGEIWYMPMDSLSLSGKKGVTLDAYGRAADPRPVIAGMALLTKWTYTGKNFIWKCELNPYAYAHRVFVNGTSLINLQYKNGKNNSLSDLTSTSEYFLENKGRSTAILYIKTNSTAVAPGLVTIIPGMPTVFGREIALIRNSSNITIRNIEFNGGGGPGANAGHLFMVMAPASNITFENCIIKRASLNGLVVTGENNSSNVVKNIRVLNCVIDKGWTKAENDIKSSVGFAEIINGDGIALWSGIDGGLIKGNYVTNWGHTAISIMSSTNAASINFGVQNLKVEQNECVAGNSMYMHAFDMMGFEGKVKNNIIKRNYFHDYSAGCTIGGNSNFVFSNIFANVITSPHPNAKKSPWGVNMTTWEVPARSGNSFVCKDNYVVNNTFFNMAAHCILSSQTYNDNAGTVYINNNRIYNNQFINFGMDTVSNLPSRKFAVALYITNNVAQKSILMRNNNFWTGYDTSATKSVALYKNKFFTTSTLNGCAPCGNENSTGNISINPRLKKSGFFELGANSSFKLRSGGYNYLVEITKQGLPVSEFVDYNGVPWPERPSIGAVQYLRP